MSPSHCIAMLKSKAASFHLCGFCFICSEYICMICVKINTFICLWKPVKWIEWKESGHMYLHHIFHGTPRTSHNTNEANIIFENKIISPPGLSKENRKKKLEYWTCFQEFIVEGAKKWLKSTKFIGNFQMLISQARSKLFGSFQSLELSSGHVVSNGIL